VPVVASRIVEVSIFALRGGEPEFLLLKRSAGEKLYPGLWQWVSGSVEPGETAVAAARRELAEETSLDPEALWVVPHVSIFYDPTHDAVNLTPVFAARVAPGSEPKLSAEHSEYLWCDLGTAMARLVWPGQREALRILCESIARGGEAAERSALR
jgi:8-oxo-dGTP pyrophosphatase MutT (NUDIX family)